MRAGLRLGLGYSAAVLVLGISPVHAQSSEPVANSADTVGPRELQNFNLNGTVTQPAPPRPAPVVPRPTTTPPASPPATSSRPPAAQQRTAPQPATRPAAERVPPRTMVSPTEPLRQSRPASSVTVALPRLDRNSLRGSARADSASTGIVPAVPIGEPGTMAPVQSPSLWPWLLAAVALGLGGAFLLWRNRTRRAFAGDADYSEFEPPEPARVAEPLARTPASPPQAPAPAFTGIVATRLRPWIELGFRPLRCIVEDAQVTIEFEIELFNSGNAPARAVLIEASLVNAGPDQDQQIGTFFANPIGKGERIVSIAPLKRVSIISKVVTPRAQIQVYDLGGRKLFVPLLAFNALYGWSSGSGQTSASFLIGRQTKSDKMAPFRLDLGPRLFRGLGQQQLPLARRD